MSESLVKKHHHIYVVRCSDDTLYTGYAVDVDMRIRAHNSGQGAKYTRSRKPVELEAQACFDDKHQALSAEYHFKRLTRKRKEEVLAATHQSETSFKDELIRLWPQLAEA